MSEPNQLRSLTLFDGLSDKELEVVSEIIEKKSYSDNTAIFLEGMPGETLYVLITGKIKVSKMLAEGEERNIAVLGPGDSFGELAILDAGPRLVTARVSEMAEVLTIKRGDAVTLMSSEPLIYSKLVSNIVRVFAERIREGGEKIKEIIRG